MIRGRPNRICERLREEAAAAHLMREGIERIDLMALASAFRPYRRRSRDIEAITVRRSSAVFTRRRRALDRKRPTAGGKDRVGSATR